jgi:poly(3-hydroxybutyrate) depolymerase
LRINDLAREDSQNPSRIREVGLAAHDLCAGLRPYLKRHHMEAGVGHYGVFSGKRWKNQIYPIVKNAILASD